MTEDIHRMPFGAEFLEDKGTRFSLWAPSVRHVDLVLLKGENEIKVPMENVSDGWRRLFLKDARPGDLYLFELDGGIRMPDPASRYQPHDVHGPSRIIDPLSFEWKDLGWKGRPWEETILYELHVGAFTQDGTFQGVEKRLDYLRDLGVTAVELMPVSAFPGKRDWGYDGVFPFAPDETYGTPEDLKKFVQTAHKKGIMVFLDVVYNHFGPEGNYLSVYAKDAFFTKDYHTPWGQGINFDGKHGREVRSFFIYNAIFWLEEYHMDGLRLDAVHAIRDSSPHDILKELAEAVNNGPGRKRYIHLILENDDNKAEYLKRDENKKPIWYAAQWNDDLHHSLHCLLTQEKQKYYVDYWENPWFHLERSLAEGFSYQGESSSYRGGRARGESSRSLPPTAFISFLQNHDQAGNRPFGERIPSLAGDEAIRAAVSVYLLAPSIPLIFMGEEWGAEQPFFFFCDFSEKLSKKVRDERRKAFSGSTQAIAEKTRNKIPDPGDYDTFKASVLDWHGIKKKWLTFYKELISLRKKEIIPRLKGIAGNSGQYRRVEGDRESTSSTISVKWNLGDGSSLYLFANMSARENAVKKLKNTDIFRLIYESTEGTWKRFLEGRLSPWTVVWFIAEHIKMERR